MIWSTLKGAFMLQLSEMFVASGLLFPPSYILLAVCLSNTTNFQKKCIKKLDVILILCPFPISVPMRHIFILLRTPLEHWDGLYLVTGRVILSENLMMVENIMSSIYQVSLMRKKVYSGSSNSANSK